MSTQTASTGTTGVTPNAPAMTLDVTEAAIGEIKKFMASEESLPETAGLRVRVVPGGCSGFQYSLNIEEESRQGDFVLDQNGVKIDYVTGVMGSGFTFTNPNATGSCGCGTSFTA